jgi:hypothetical protein
MAQSTRKKHWGNCGESGHSIHICPQIKALSYGKAESSNGNRLPSSVFGLPKQRKYPMEERVHQIKAEEFATKEEHAGKLSPAQPARWR